MIASRLPNLIIIGAQKSATTSLHYYLNLHPQIATSREKELDFFIEERNWHKGIDWYKLQFISGSRVCGEASPDYTAYPFYGGVPTRMHSVVPNAKLIYILRDPVERIISHYVHRCAAGLEHRSMEKAVKENNGHNRYVYRSKYFMQLEQYLPFYSESQILVVGAEDLRESRRAVMRKIFRFLRVDDSYWSPRFLFMWHRSKFKRRLPEGGSPAVGAVTRAFGERLPFELRGLFRKFLQLPFTRKIEKPVLDGHLRSVIIKYLKEDIERLRKYTREAFDGWSV